MYVPMHIRLSLDLSCNVDDLYLANSVQKEPGLHVVAIGKVNECGYDSQPKTTAICDACGQCQMFFADFE